jgi:DNA sulfur modification protein DndE
MLENIRLSKTASDQLSRLKRLTGISQWNIICRWAFCLSLAEAGPPRNLPIPTDGSVEMTWRTFAGHNDAAFRLLLRQRCRLEGIPLSDRDLALQFRLHLHRGIGYLAGDPSVKSIEGFVSLARSREDRAQHAESPTT